jgi:exonuclease VII small subunit
MHQEQVFQLYIRLRACKSLSMSLSLHSKLLAQQAKEEIIIQALKYYSEAIEKVKMAEEWKVGKELIVKDTERISKDVENALRNLESGQAVNIVVTIETQNDVLCDALTVYESGLKETRESYCKILGAKPKLTNIDNAITAIKGIKSEFCAGRSG